MFIFLAIVGLSVLVFFHELGHFVVAKIFKIRVEEFGFGYPPRICGFIFRGSQGSSGIFFWGKNEPPEAKTRTIYSLNWIPFGGFNKLKGELEEETKDSDSFFAQVWWKKAAVACGGVVMNIFLAFLIFAFCYFIGVPQAIEQVKGGKILRPVGIQIGLVAPDSPAAEGGLKIGDVIIGLDGQSFQKVEEVQNYIRAKNNQSLEIEVRRREEIIKKTVNILPAYTVFKDMEESYGVMGVALSQTAIVAYPWHQSIILGAQTTVLIVGKLFSGLWLIFKNLLVRQKMIGELLGPVGITSMATEIARAGFIYFLQFIGLLSVAIGAFQMIPFPALDGSRVVFAIIEGFKGEPINRRVEAVIVSLGFYILLLLLFFITSKEIFRLF